MTGDQVFHDDDDDLNLDNEFILEDWDAGDDAEDEDFLVLDDDAAADRIDDLETPDVDFGDAEASIDDDLFDEPASVDAELEPRAVADDDNWGSDLDDWEVDAEESPSADASSPQTEAESTEAESTEADKLSGMFGSGAPARGDGEARPSDVDFVAQSDRVESAEEDGLFETGGATERPASFEGVEPKVFAESDGDRQGLGWDQLDLENAVDQMVDSPATHAENAESEEIGFDMLDDADQAELTLIDGDGHEVEINSEHVESTELPDRTAQSDRIGQEADDLFEEDGFGLSRDAHEPIAADADCQDYDDDVEDGYDDEFEAPEIDYSHSDFELSEEVDPEWAPVEENDEDDDEAPEEEEELFEYVPEDGAYEEPDYSDYEESYFEDAEHAATSGVVRQGLWRRVAGVAAALAMMTLPAVYLLKPEWLNLRVAPEIIEVIAVDRPLVAVNVEVPTLDPVDQTEVAKVDPPSDDGNQPGPEDPPKAAIVELDPKGNEPASPVVVKTDPVPQGSETGDGKPAVDDPATSTVVAADPKTANPAAVAPVHVESGLDPSDPKLDRSAGPAVAAVGSVPGAAPVQIDDEGSAFLTEGNDGDLMEQHRKSVVQDENGLVMGSQALAQLYNDNIFVGTVKALNASFVTLRVKTGEITLARAEVRTLTTLAAIEAKEWQKSITTGYLRLRNSNRLKGKIVETRDDAVILQVNSNRVVVPLSAIEEVSSGSDVTVQMRESMKIDNDKWFRDLVERELENDAKERVAVPKVATPGK